MNPVSTTIKTIIDNTPGYTIRDLLSELQVSIDTNVKKEKSDPWYSVAEAAIYCCGKSHTTIRRAAKAKLLKSNKKDNNRGTEYSFRSSWLDRWMMKGAPSGYKKEREKSGYKR